MKNDRGHEKNCLVRFLLVLCIIVAIVAILLYAWGGKTKPRKILVIMVKNDEHTISRLLTSAYWFVASELFICDMGSTDKTLFIAPHHWPGNITIVRINGTTQHFDEMRNKCRDALAKNMSSRADPPEWVALADAQYELGAHLDMPLEPTNDFNMIHVSPANQNNLLLLKWKHFVSPCCRYRLWAHEFLDCSQCAGYKQHVFNGYSWIDHSKPEKTQQNILLLEQWLQQVPDPELRPLVLYHLARDLELSGRQTDALFIYAKHNEVQPYTNYQFYAHYRMARITMDQFRNRHANVTFEDAERAAIAAATTYDGYFRREPFYWLAWLARMEHLYHQCVIYASTALSLPEVDYSRMPLFLEERAYQSTGPLEERDFCVQQIKAALR